MNRYHHRNHISFEEATVLYHEIQPIVNYHAYQTTRWIRHMKFVMGRVYNTHIRIHNDAYADMNVDIDIREISPMVIQTRLNNIVDENTTNGATHPVLGNMLGNADIFDPFGNQSFVPFQDPDQVLLNSMSPRRRGSISFSSSETVDDTRNENQYIRQFVPTLGINTNTDSDSDDDRPNFAPYVSTPPPRQLTNIFSFDDAYGGLDELELHRRRTQQSHTDQRTHNMTTRSMSNNQSTGTSTSSVNEPVYRPAPHPETINVPPMVLRPKTPELFEYNITEPLPKLESPIWTGCYLPSLQQLTPMLEEQFLSRATVNPTGDILPTDLPLSMVLVSPQYKHAIYEGIYDPLTFLSWKFVAVDIIPFVNPPAHSKTPALLTICFAQTTLRFQVQLPFNVLLEKNAKSIIWLSLNELVSSTTWNQHLNIFDTAHGRLYVKDQLLRNTLGDSTLKQARFNTLYDSVYDSNIVKPIKPTTKAFASMKHKQIQYETGVDSNSGQPLHFDNSQFLIEKIIYVSTELFARYCNFALEYHRSCYNHISNQPNFFYAPPTFMQ